jgi:hypothetical protein
MEPWQFAIYVVFFGLLLSLPTSRMIFIFSARRLQRNLGRNLSDEEVTGQKRRALIIAVFVCLVFSFLFSAFNVGIPHRG